MDLKRKYELLDSESNCIECPLCFELLSPPVYQCDNGHIACTPCREKLRRKECPYCRSKKVAHSRNLAVEKILDSLVTSCKYSPQGCKALLKIADTERHENDMCECRFGVPAAIRNNGTESGARKKRRVRIDCFGVPVCRMSNIFLRDVKKYTKDLDPRVGWDKQPSHLKERFFELMYADWDVRGSSRRVSEKAIKPRVTKALISMRHRINRLIDMRRPRPEGLEAKYWDSMVISRCINRTIEHDEQMNTTD